MKPKYLLFIGLILGVAATGTATAADFTVFNVGSTAYNVNGAQNRTLTLTRGVAYTFAINASGHPFFIKTARVIGLASAFNTGVTGNGTDSGTLGFAVPQSAPNTLFYQCEFHGSMGGTIQVRDPSSVSPEAWTAIKRLFE
jgi:hypothetical protein